jgi:TolA-binding protein
MATTPLIPLGLLFSCMLAPSLLATGGGYDEEPGLTLDALIKGLPAKSISSVLGDQGISLVTNSASVIVPDELRAEFSKGPSARLAHAMDSLLREARKSCSSAADLNLLQDLKDLSLGKASASEAGAYVDWRLAHRDLFMKPSDKMSWDRPKIDPQVIAELDGKIAASSEALLPHWIYLKGAYYYNLINDTESEKCFDRILKEYPSAPRAETALFMKGRCLLSQSVKIDNPHAVKLEEARKWFIQYLQTYPEGRYRNDVLGWLGGVDYRSGHYAEAIDSYIRQVENTEHPEDQPAAVAMIEKCFYHASDSNDLELDHLARHPAAAMALAYYAIHQVSLQANWWNSQDEINQTNANRTSWRSKILSKLADAVLAEKKYYRSRLDLNRFVAILAHAASDQGKAKEATELLKLAGKTPENDDVAYVKALILQRSGRLDECVAAYRDFLKKYPGSPLASGVHYRLGLALHDLQKDGSAIREVAQLSGKDPTQNNWRSQPELTANTSGSFIGEDYSGASPALVDQTFDTFLNFATVPSLTSAFEEEGGTLRDKLADVISGRLLANEDWAALRRFQKNVRIPYPGTSELLKLIPEQPSSSRVTNALQIGDLWATNVPLQCALVEPLDNRGQFAGVLSSRLARLTNASVLGFTNAIEEFDKRNPWIHAIAWWSNGIAADPTNSATADAQWNIVRARRMYAATSAYTQNRAADTDLQAVARREYDQLISNNPSSAPARLAAYWTFPNREEIDAAHVNANEMLWRSPYSEDAWYEAMGCTKDERYEDQVWTSVCRDLGSLAERVRDQDAKGFRKDVADLVSRAAPAAYCMERMPLMNCLTDLVQLGQSPGFDSLDHGIRDRYLKLRLDILRNAVWANIWGLPRPDHEISDGDLQIKVRELAAVPEAQPIKDFVDFLEPAILSNHIEQFRGFNERNYPLVDSTTALYMEKHPQSPKREVALSLRLRAIDYTARYHPVKDFNSWPYAYSWQSKTAQAPEQLAPFDKETFNKTLATYEKEYPLGENRHAVLSYRVDAAYQQGDWPTFLDLAEQLDKTSEKPFREQLANELAWCFLHLDKDSERASLLSTVLSRPWATSRLKDFIEKGRGIPYLREYLLEQIKKNT